MANYGPFRHSVDEVTLQLQLNSLTVAVPYTGRLTLLQYITIKS